MLKLVLVLVLMLFASVDASLLTGCDGLLVNSEICFCCLKSDSVNVGEYVVE